MAYWNSRFPTRQHTDHAAAKAALAANLREPGRMEALRTMVGLSKTDTEAIIERCRVPALVVMGSRDPYFPDAVAEAHWLGAALGIDPVIVEGAGHSPAWRCPSTWPRRCWRSCRACAHDSAVPAPGFNGWEHPCGPQCRLRRAADGVMPVRR